MTDLVSVFLNAQDPYINVFIAALRWVAPALAAILLFRCVKPLLTFRREPEIWAWLCLTDGSKLPVTHWENVIGRSKSCDITIIRQAVRDILQLNNELKLRQQIFGDG